MSKNFPRDYADAGGHFCERRPAGPPKTTPPRLG